ncbi:aminotransferase class I/II-fold pyridoxal phosphate-dependent enzyme [Paenibacillus sp. HN-1]|uniref:aminotransferase class I/II-fold pyridoxal phosphate-dependent enzyme n=1 Tax=Paenibacillus TaxID=44249 RepID=UPI001CA802DC|nr:MULTISPECIES: aminotransferase class I/II-fold pyridoxal phosphate-dependent enzyme [Paenibacillus]MBY9080125.1 aminotransferase class I/II-fold pyridoxal phosphate-dependent enzyme [Paenibacillus sp. CGMCC 1.18879]MBY9083171.1 aminotransferase class I/II-fold pyridoxal phosphate-dependent enzyme [Paenibacillus sinensis]
MQTKQNDLSEYLTTLMRKKVSAAKESGLDVIDFTIGNPDLPPPAELLEQLIQEIRLIENHSYPNRETQGSQQLCEAIATFYRNRFHLELDPALNVMPLIGSKECAHYLCVSLLKPGDLVIIVEPCYPTYKVNAVLAGAEVFELQTNAENDYLPNLDDIPEHILRRAKLFFTNYPNNPTGATAPLSFYSKLVDLARTYNFIICNDNVYSELYYDEHPPHSILEVPNSLEVAVESHSLSKTLNICGWRVGMLSGNRMVIKRVLNVKQYADAGIFMPIQIAASKAMLTQEQFVSSLRDIYCHRKQVLQDGLIRNGYWVYPSTSGMYVWARIPEHRNAPEHVEFLLSKGIAVNPGKAYGDFYSDYVRFSLNVPINRIEQAIERIVTNS